MQKYEAVVIGTGFGGAIAACRLAKKWPGQVLVLERGKRYPMGSFPRAPHDMANNFWAVDGAPRALRRQQEERRRGLFDIRNYRHMDVVLAAGVGGGSLIYASVFLEPPDHVIDDDDRWPASCKKEKLRPYYRVAKRVLGARPIPDMTSPERVVPRTRLFQQVGQSIGRKSELLDLNVFFGNDPARPTPIGVQEVNRHGALQTSCVYCAECNIGCNTHSKNTLDLNYLFVAEHEHGAELRSEHHVQGIVPVDAEGGDAPAADGRHGYRVYFDDLDHGYPGQSVLAKRVVVSAGSLGSTELLLRCERKGMLPELSATLGHNFSGNGDFLCLSLDGDRPSNPNRGPVITQRIDCNLFEDYDPARAFILEDAAYPVLLAWFAEGAKPGVLRLGPLWRSLRSLWRRYVQGRDTGRLGEALREILKGDLSYRTNVMLCMGIDRSNGVMTLGADGFLDIHWPFQDSRPLYDRIVETCKRFSTVVRGDFTPLPTWFWPVRKNITVHPLGGAVLADDAEHGVVSAAPETFGQVFGYQGLYVADGAIVPSAVGANPIATISALSEMIAASITGLAPDPEGSLQ